MSFRLPIRARKRTEA
uniref:Uncharacterized protein n=1 Tax=Rhizophora mucronata TaxID=61149 RepID=A0A2P2K9Q5_RHIMU